MKISELPEGIKKIALEYRRKENVYSDTDSLFLAFNWHNTIEGYDFWHKLHNQC